ncbi:hypothetical protein FLK61_26105 [Paenalkalicoccus suaedae]|uniref:Uncharacterized protein n=1 Tax=Paenalkalicoccus suaedae TaxID=2592382 RepID=A0A859FB45_9BACI|nr:hypothetical protein [Paenalkalicoccus suaedae]QKS70237.1 hypothetical protein FLK61_26105 [Paenalkalicoccus suaedae]
MKDLMNGLFTLALCLLIAVSIYLNYEKKKSIDELNETQSRYIDAWESLDERFKAIVDEHFRCNEEVEVCYD